MPKPSLTNPLADAVHTTGEAALWWGALVQLVNDGKAHHNGRPGWGAAAICKAAHDDLVSCGPSTRWLAHWCCLDPSDISEAFRDWCLKTPG